MRLLPGYLDDAPLRVRRALAWSTLDGMFFCLMNGMGSCAIPLYAVALGMSNLVIGLVATLPILAGSASQLLSPALERLCGSRKRAVLAGCMVQVAGWAAIPWVSRLDEGREAALLAITTVQNIGWFVTIPIWLSWFGDLVPPLHRARFSAFRSLPCQACEFLSIIAMGWWLAGHETMPVAEQIEAFRKIFWAAAAFRFLSVVCLALKHEPAVGHGVDAAPSLPPPRPGAGLSPFALATAFYGIFHLALFVSAPYFAPYMRMVHLDYWEIAWILAIPFPARMLFLPAWARASARYGNRSVILVSGALTALIPVLWIFSSDWRYLVAVQVVNGIFWGGIELAELPYVLELTRPAERTARAAVYFSFRSLCDCLGALGGDLTMRHLAGKGPLTPFLAVFVVSGAGRLATCLWGRRGLAETAPDAPRAGGGRILAEVLALK